ncbi:hypothetical protein AGLY_004238 [Aphis glycines]|uniref:Uncharacterized protein n=1 Tax=Aphis glycines TaxID=307491 RepID=A0A6G0TZU6_APHGL|nr:hypothetical protein AGLY_004238 [Aphis glycines]
MLPTEVSATADYKKYSEHICLLKLDPREVSRVSFMLRFICSYSYSWHFVKICFTCKYLILKYNRQNMMYSLYKIICVALGESQTSKIDGLAEMGSDDLSIIYNEDIIRQATGTQCVISLLVKGYYKILLAWIDKLILIKTNTYEKMRILGKKYFALLINACSFKFHSTSEKDTIFQCWSIECNSTFSWGFLLKQSLNAHKIRNYFDRIENKLECTVFYLLNLPFNYLRTSFLLYQDQRYSCVIPSCMRHLIEMVVGICVFTLRLPDPELLRIHLRMETLQGSRRTMHMVQLHVWPCVISIECIAYNNILRNIRHFYLTQPTKNIITTQFWVTTHSLGTSDYLYFTEVKFSILKCNTIFHINLSTFNTNTMFNIMKSNFPYRYCCHGTWIFANHIFYWHFLDIIKETSHTLFIKNGYEKITMRVKTASVFCIIIQGVQHLIVRGTKSAFEN